MNTKYVSTWAKQWENCHNQFLGIWNELNCHDAHCKAKIKTVNFNPSTLLICIFTSSCGFRKLKKKGNNLHVCNNNMFLISVSIHVRKCHHTVSLQGLRMRLCCILNIIKCTLPLTFIGCFLVIQIRCLFKCSHFRNCHKPIYGECYTEVPLALNQTPHWYTSQWNPKPRSP